MTVRMAMIYRQIEKLVSPAAYCALPILLFEHHHVIVNADTVALL